MKKLSLKKIVLTFVVVISALSTGAIAENKDTETVKSQACTWVMIWPDPLIEMLVCI